ncbi:MAG: 3-deoxy-D-manno-octulosonic acid transferase [Bacteroidales bacterium]
MRQLYTLSVILYGLGIRFAALFNTKARLWTKGRKNFFPSLRQHFKDTKKTAWFHCASLGEFEQGRPVLEAFTEKNPDYRILLTFFSPSGYEIRKNYSKAGVITYLPLDTPSNARQFINIVNPNLVFFIKYEYWYNYIDVLHNAGIPVYIVSGIFRKNQHFFSWYGGWFRRQIKKISYFFLQNQHSLELLQSIGIQHAVVSGDTRFDRVSAVALSPVSYPKLREWRNKKQVILAGSTWPEDERILFHLINKLNDTVSFIVAPHEVHEQRIQEIISGAGIPSVRFSQLETQNSPLPRLIIIDTIGQLSSLYQYADVALIGGGFGKGIHNILEAATFGLPVIFGPNYQKFFEARELLALKGAFTINTGKEAEIIVNELFTNPEILQKAGNLARDFVLRNTGATEIILQFIEKNS